jgi:uncharacterized protein DUF3311
MAEHSIPKGRPDVVMAPPALGRRPSRLWYLLLAAPFAGLLYPPLYSREHPMLGGFPFFYWYQLAWVPVSAVLIYVVYRSTHAGRSWDQGGERS